MSGSQRKQALQHFQRLQDASYSRVHTACKYTAVAVGDGLENVTFDQLTTKPLYEAFGSYLALHAVAHGNGGNGALMPGTCLVYLNAFILAAEERADELARGASRDAAAAAIQQKQQFFSCMSDAPTAPSRWLRGLRNRVRNHALGRRIECGLPSSHAAQPLYYVQHIRKVSEAYAKMGTTEAAKARALIMITYAAAGRTAEAVYLTFDSLNVDTFYGCLVSTIYQPKTGKLKDVPFVAARDRHADVALAMADHFVLNRFKPYCPDDAAYVFPDVVMLSNPNDKLNSFIRNVNRCDTATADPRTGVELFEGACAAGIRRGNANELHSVMPAQFAVALTGHEMTGFTKLYEYINSNVANAITAATVLGRWPAPVFGHTTIGPRLPSVEAIIDIVGEGVRTTLEDIVDVLFNVDDAAPPMVMRERDGRPRGKFRTGLLHMFATLIMHSDDRDAAGEMVIVNETLRTAVARSVDEAPRVVISRWGRAIRRKFDADNHHLVAATATPEAQATVNVIAELAGQVAELSRAVAAQNEVLGKLTSVQECAIRRHSDGMECNGAIDEMPMRDAHNDDRDTMPVSCSALFPIGDTPPAVPPTASALISIGDTQPSVPPTASALIPIGDTQPAVLATGFDLLTGPQPDKRKETDANTDAQTLFLKMRGEEPTGGVGIAAQTLDRRKKVFHILMGFTYDGDEMKLMQSRKAEDDGKRRLLVQKLERYFALFLACVYIGHNMKVPADLQRALPDSLKENVGTVGQKRASRSTTILKPFKVSTYENRNKDLLTKCKFVLTKNHKPDKKLLQAWRRAYEETGELRPITAANSISSTGEGSMSMEPFVGRT